jgi:hypothetical protein
MKPHRPRQTSSAGPILFMLALIFGGAATILLSILFKS